jgi:hypothetical protein
MILKPRQLLLIALICSMTTTAFSQEKSFDELDGAEIIVYKTVDDFDLKLSIIYPQDFKKRKKHPAIIFFFRRRLECWQSATIRASMPLSGRSRNDCHNSQLSGKIQK